MKRMKTAILGCGSVSDMYMQSIQEQFTVLDLCACCDVRQDRMETAAKKYGLTPMSFDAILADPEIELVINLTPPAGHYPLTKKALEHGKHVYSEKMLAVHLEEAKDLCRIAQEHHVRLGCAPDTFLGGGLQTARYAIDKGLLGTIHSGVVSLSKNDRVYVENLTHLYSHGGSVLFDMGSYYLTALCSLLGPVKEIFAFGTKSERERPVTRVGSAHFGKVIPLEDCNVLTALLSFASGTQVTLHFNAASILNQSFHLELYGEGGILQMGDPNTFGASVTLQKAQNEPVSLPFTHGYQEQSRGLGAAEMAWAIAAGRPHRASMDMACHVLEIVHGVFTSIENRRIYTMTTQFDQPAPLPEGYIGHGFWEPAEESALL